MKQITYYLITRESIHGGKEIDNGALLCMLIITTSLLSRYFLHSGVINGSTFNCANALIINIQFPVLFGAALSANIKIALMFCVSMIVNLILMMSVS